MQFWGAKYDSQVYVYVTTFATYSGHVWIVDGLKQF